MSTKNLDNIDFLSIVLRIKQHKNLQHDWEVAKLLGFTKAAFSERKRRKRPPIDRLEIFCEKESINIEWLLTGEGSKYQEEKSMPGMINESTVEYADKKLNDLVGKLQHIYKEGSVTDRALIRGTIDEVYDILIEKIVSRTKDPAAEPALKKNHAG